MTTHLCKHADDEHVPAGRWIASLSNGETIYEDCDPNEDRCWVRLGQYCKDNNIKITQMRWQYAHMEHISTKDAEGYCIVRKMRSYGTAISTQEFCGIGYIKDDIAYLMYLSSSGNSFREERHVNTLTNEGQIIYNV